MGVGCASTSPATTEVHMDPVVVQAEPDPLTGLDSYDAEELFELGNEEFAAGNYGRSAEIFEKLVDTFPGSELVVPAAYNAALSHEKRSAWKEAAEWFRWVVREHPDAPSAKDAHFSLGLAYGKLERWVEVADTYWAIRQREGLTELEELEARVNTGVGFFMQEDYLSAEREFMRALAFVEEQDREQFLPARYFIGQSRFYLGEIYARWFEKKRLQAPEGPSSGDAWVEQVGADLEEKCQLLLRAQSNFIRTIRVGHTGWATAAGYRIGSLYETLYDQMMDVPVPGDLSPEARELYVSELQKRVGVLVVKAIRVYEMSLEMAERVGERNEWVERTSESLQRMKTLYERELLDS
jgi:tetratricopeptide (TPR) repeat protein